MGVKQIRGVRKEEIGLGVGKTDLGRENRYERENTTDLEILTEVVTD